MTLALLSAIINTENKLKAVAMESLESKTTNMADATALSNSDINDQYMVFELDNELFGIPVLSVQTIISYTEPSAIPNSPKHMKGVINLRGTVIPIVDMRLRFNIEEKEYDDTTIIIVVMIGENQYGIIVDAVSDVLTIPQDNIQTNIDLQSGIDQSYITGIGKLNETMVVLIDIAKMFSKEELKVMAEAK